MELILIFVLKIKPSNIWLIGLLLSVFVPLVGGTLGRVNQMGGLLLEGTSGILSLTFIYIIYSISLTVVLSVILISVGKWRHRTDGQLLGPVLMVSILGFIVAFLFLNILPGGE
jgi:formate hydrogenlyase subunit 3/multisubunit Na+/H+ antiporter MnhD subunit